MCCFRQLLLVADDGSNSAQRLAEYGTLEKGLAHTQALDGKCMCTICSRKDGKLKCRDVETDCVTGAEKGPDDVFVKCVRYPPIAYQQHDRIRETEKQGERKRERFVSVSTSVSLSVRVSMRVSESVPESVSDSISKSLCVYVGVCVSRFLSRSLSLSRVLSLSRSLTVHRKAESERERESAREQDRQRERERHTCIQTVEH